MISESASFFSSPHLFAVCNAGSEKFLKADIAFTHPDLRPAFMRPQLVTWKSPIPLNQPPQSIFARVSGLSLGMFQEVEQIATALEGFREDALHLHVFPREVPVDGMSPEQWSQIDRHTADIRAKLIAAGMPLHDPRAPREGESVLDIVLDVSPDGKFLAGLHQHGPDTHPCPGAIPKFSLPPEAPSRAWLKMEDALVFARLDSPAVLRGRVALELGSAPGGASLSLLQHGVTVFGIDAAEMDRRVLDFSSPEGAHFVHFKMNAGQVPPSLLPGRADLLVCDLNAAPHVIIPIVERLQTQLHASVFLLTMKMNDEATVARIPEFLRRLRRSAPSPLRATQLASNRSEFCVVAGRLPQ
jgi:23S rRNA (cytidine2498-2'-O)-methyltransferase